MEEDLTNGLSSRENSPMKIAAKEISPDLTLDQFKALVAENHWEEETLSLPTLYKKALNGKISQWTIYWDLDRSVQFTIYGYLDGKKQQTKDTAIKELKVKTDLLDIGWVKFHRKYENQLITKQYATKIYENAESHKKENCMLAKQLKISEETQKIADNRTNDKIKKMVSKGEGKGIELLVKTLLAREIISRKEIASVEAEPAKYLKKLRNKKEAITFPVYLQHKIDGVRTLTYQNPLNTDIIYLSRSNRNYNLIGQYMDQEVSRFLKCLSKYSPAPELDGEMYSPDYDFNSLVGIIQASTNESDELKNITYHIFDYTAEDNLPFQKRFSNLKKALKDYRSKYGEPQKFLLLDCFIAMDMDELINSHREFVQEGWEGTIIRKVSLNMEMEDDPSRLKEALYVKGRTSNLMKITDWLSAEGKVLDVIPGKGKFADQGIFVIENPFYNPKNPESKETFKCTPAVTEEEKREYLAHKKRYIGREYTFEYKSITVYDCPIKVKGKAFRDYE